MALKPVPLAENRAYGVRSSRATTILGDLKVPEDGFDEDEFGENCISTTWVVRNTFLELQSNDTTSTKMTLRRSDSWLVVGKATSSDLRKRRGVYDTNACSEDDTTGESPAERVPGLQHSSVFLNAGSNLEAASISIQRRQAPATSKIEDIACNLRSNTDAALSFEPSYDEADPAYASSWSIKTDCSPIHGVRAGETLGFVTERCNQSLESRTGIDCCAMLVEPVNHVQSSLTMSPTAPLMAMPFMMLTTCPTQTPTQTRGPAKPPGNFSNSLSDAQAKKQEFVGQPLFSGQRQRLDSDSSASSGMTDFTSNRSLCKDGIHGGFSGKIQRNAGICGATTVILHDMPKGFSRDNVVELLNSQGFRNMFNFIYVPIRFGTMNTLGYAFVNFVSPAAAEECCLKLEGFTGWDEKCENVVHVGWSDNDQGLDAIIQRHRNSPVMHASVSDEFKPAIYVNGIRAEFPQPTKTIRAPRAQRCKNPKTLEKGEDA